jgi:Zn-dependent protease with chaperone function
MAKKAYKIQILNIDDVSSLDRKQRIVWDTVNDLAERNHIKTPEIGIYMDSEANAFAT